jgi:hypothetical protein
VLAGYRRARIRGDRKLFASRGSPGGFVNLAPGVTGSEADSRIPLNPPLDRRARVMLTPDTASREKVVANTSVSAPGQLLRLRSRSVAHQRRVMPRSNRWRPLLSTSRREWHPPDALQTVVSHSQAALRHGSLEGCA